MQVEQAKAHWNSQAKDYKENFEAFTLTPSITLANMLEVQKSQDILEVACATGNFSLHFLRNLTNTKTFTSVDISESMIEEANARKAATEGVNQGIKHEFVVADGEDLNFIKDESIDTYISNFCVHLVPDERKFLQEARRVLKKGGKIGLIVPCRENGFVGSLVDQFEAAGWKFPFSKNFWGFGKREIMIKLLEDNGFEVRYCWEDHMKLPYYEESDIDKQMNVGPFGAIFNSFDEDTKKVIRENILKELSERKKEFNPFQIRTVSIVAQKPLN